MSEDIPFLLSLLFGFVSLWFGMLGMLAIDSLLLGLLFLFLAGGFVVSAIKYF